MHVYLCIPATPTRLWVYAPLLCTPHGPAASLSTAPSPSPSPSPSPDRAHLLEHGVERGHGLHLPYTSPTPPLHLPYLSQAGDLVIGIDGQPLRAPMKHVVNPLVPAYVLTARRSSSA